MLTSIYDKSSFKQIGSLNRLTFFRAWGVRYFSPSRWAGAVDHIDEKVYNLFIYIFDLIIHTISFIMVSKCAQSNFLWLNIFQVDDKDVTTNIREKSEQMLKMDDASVRHHPNYVFLEDFPVHQLPDKALSWYMADKVTLYSIHITHKQWH